MWETLPNYRKASLSSAQLNEAVILNKTEQNGVE